MLNHETLPGIEDLWDQSLGSSEICIAVLDPTFGSPTNVA